MPRIKRMGKVLVAYLEGELDHHHAEGIRNAIDAVILEEMPEKLVFDLSGVTFMDSSGIGIIMGRYRAIQASGGSVAFIGIGKKIDKLMEVSGLLKIIPQFGSLEEVV